MTFVKVDLTMLSVFNHRFTYFVMLLVELLQLTLLTMFFFAKVLLQSKPRPKVLKLLRKLQENEDVSVLDLRWTIWLD